MSLESRKVWAPLKRVLDAHRWHYQRFEDKITPGIPDVNVYVPGVGELWVEMKYVKAYPKQMTSRVHVGLRAEQLIWLEAAARAGRRACVLARVDSRWVLWENPKSWAALHSSHPWLLLKSVSTQEFSTPDEVVTWMSRQKIPASS
jgi:hypothetical protein